MKNFIKRIERAINYQKDFDNESFPFQAIVVFSVFLYTVFKLIYGIILFVTVPVWIIPYAIITSRRSK